MAGKKFLSLAADIFPHYFLSSSQAFVVTLTVLPGLVSLRLQASHLQTLQVFWKRAVHIRISSRAGEHHQSTAHIPGCARNIKDTNHPLLSFIDFFINSPSKTGRLHTPCGRARESKKQEFVCPARDRQHTLPSRKTGA